MDKKQITRTWISLIIPFTAGSLLFIYGLYRYFSNTGAASQVRYFFVCLLGATLIYFAGKKIWTFRRWLKENRNKRP